MSMYTVTNRDGKPIDVYIPEPAPRDWHTLDAEAHESAAQLLIAQGYTRHTARHIYREEFRKAGQPTQVLGRPLGSLAWTPRTLEAAS